MAIWLLRKIIQSAKEKTKDMIMIFIDLVIAFDSVNIEALAKALKDYGITNHIKCLLWDVQQGERGEIEGKTALNLKGAYVKAGY